MARPERSTWRTGSAGSGTKATESAEMGIRFSPLPFRRREEVLMKRTGSKGLVVAVCLALVVGVAVAIANQAPGAKPAWSLSATIIEACSCEMFCPCYFSTEPSPAHGEHGYCKFNMAHKINKGKAGDVDLA